MAAQPDNDESIGSAEYWRDIKAAGQLKRARNRECSSRMLVDCGVRFVRKNEGAHLIVYAADENRFDFWPGTGRWRETSGTRAGFGIRSLLAIVAPPRA